MQATYGCGDAAITTLGSAFEKKTIEYSSRFLAYGTLSSPNQRCDNNVVVGGFHTIDFSSLYYDPIVTSTTTKAGCPPFVNPRLSLPAELTDIDPAWKTCQPLHYGAFDPPRALTAANGPLGPPKVGQKPAPALEPTHVPMIMGSESGLPIPTAQAGTPPAIPAPTAPPVQDPPHTAGENVPSENPPHEPAPQPELGGAKQPSPVPNQDIPSASQPPNGSPGGIPRPDDSTSNVDSTPPEAPAPNIPPLAAQDPPSTALEQPVPPKQEVPTALQNPGTSAANDPSSHDSPPVVPVVALPNAPASNSPSSGPFVLLPEDQLPPAAAPHNDYAPSVQAVPGKTVSSDGASGEGGHAPNLQPQGPVIVALPPGPASEDHPPSNNDQHTGGGSGAPSVPVLGSIEPSTAQGPAPVPGSSNNQNGVVQNNKNDELNVGGGSAAPSPGNAILIGLSGSSRPENVFPEQQSGSGAVNPGTSARPSPPRLAVLETPTPLNVEGHPVDIDLNGGGIIIAGSTVASGQQVTIGKTPVSVNKGNLVIGGATHAFVDQAQQPNPSTIFIETTQQHTLAPGGVATISGKLTTNIGASPVVLSQVTSVPISTVDAAVAAQNEIAYSPSIIHSQQVQRQTLAPGSVATINGIATTNTGPTAIILSETKNTPIATTFIPQAPVPALVETTIYSSSFASYTLAPGAVTTIDGTPTTNTFSTPLTLSIKTRIPIATSTVPTFNQDRKPAQIYKVNGRLLTATSGIYGVSEISAVPTGKGKAVTIGLVDPENGSTTRTTVVVLPTDIADKYLGLSDKNATTSSGGERTSSGLSFGFTSPTEDATGGRGGASGTASSSSAPVVSAAAVGGRRRRRRFGFGFWEEMPILLPFLFLLM